MAREPDTSARPARQILAELALNADAAELAEALGSLEPPFGAVDLALCVAELANVALNAIGTWHADPTGAGHADRALNAAASACTAAFNAVAILGSLDRHRDRDATVHRPDTESKHPHEPEDRRV